MKTKLLIAALFLFTSSHLFSQVTWIGQGTDSNWSNPDNWGGNVIPSQGDDVLIPTGFNVNADSIINVLSLTVEGNSIVNIQNGFTFSNPSVFRQNTTINCFDGSINGQGSILTSEGTINVMISNLFNLSNSTTLNNLGTINFISGFIGIIGDSVLNNSGIIDFKANNFAIYSSSSPNVLNNTGLIKTSFPNTSDEASIGCPIINTGTLQIEIGTLNLNSSAVNFTGGLYHVAAGAVLNLNSPITASGILTGNVFGDLNLNNDLIVASTAVFDFSGNNIINWQLGDLDGGGTLTNLSIINIGIVTLKGVTILDNDGEIRCTSSDDIFISTGSVINNNATGLIDFQVNGSEIRSNGSAPNILNNIGVIKTSFPNPSDQSIIRVQLNNNNGTIQLDNGTLLFSNANTTLTDGMYNIATNATLKWILPITISGLLNGILDGSLAWEGDLLVPTSASFSFAGDGSVLWATNSLSGGGTLTNEHTIITVSGANKRIDGATTLVNNADIKSSGFLRIGTNSTLSNSVTGTIDIETNGSSFGTVNSAPHTFINSGLLVASFPEFSTFISAPLNNFGIIEATSAEIEFSNTLINETSGIIRGSGIIDLPPSGNFTNNGIIAPGNSPGTLSVIGNYVSASTTQLHFELNGLTPNTEYDLLAIQGSASFEGNVQIVLGFDANVNDEFIVATTTNTINTCNLPVSATSSFDGSDYIFDVLCRDNNELVLTVTNETLGLNSFDNEEDIKLFPNPATDVVSFSDKTVGKIEVFDLSGKLIKRANSYSISVNTLDAGLYLIRGVNDSNHSIIKRLIKI